MEIVLVGYVLYASAVLIWCSSTDPPTEDVRISPDLLAQWSDREDLIVFELYPEPGSPRSPGSAWCGGEGACPPPAAESGKVLSVTPAGLMALMNWLPPSDHVVLCNHGVSQPSLRAVRAALARHCVPRVYWLENATAPARCTAPGVSAALH